MFSAADLSRYLRSQGYTTRTTYSARYASMMTWATKRQAAHRQHYVYPIRNSDQQPGAVWIDTFGIAVTAHEIIKPGDSRNGWIDGRDLRDDVERHVLNSGGLDYYGPA